MALKLDGRFLSAEDGGPITFGWDQGAEATEEMERVPWVKRIVIRWD
ncbi:MAG: hypothetical protein R6U88_06045 [Candidatus Bipolaricaulota bacterium]